MKSSLTPSCSPAIGRMKLVAVLAVLLSPAALAQHVHLNAGAAATVVGSPVSFLNGARYSAEAGYVIPLTAATSGPYAGYHHGSITFTAVPASEFLGGPVPGHALPGTHLEMRIVSVAGPAGGSFGFWETPGGEQDGTELTFSLPVGTTDGTRSFPLSENSGLADEDPFGHFHGRKFTATLPGLYRVGSQAVDTAASGPDGGPLHTPSEVLTLNFQAGVTIASTRLTEAGLELTFATTTDKSHFINRALPTTATPVWTAVAGPFPGDGRMLTVGPLPTDEPAAWFRLRLQ